MKDLETLCVYAGIKRFSAANIRIKNMHLMLCRHRPVCSGFLWTFAALLLFTISYLLSFGTSADQLISPADAE
jgi:hypothetical protein